MAVQRVALQLLRDRVSVRVGLGEEGRGGLWGLCCCAVSPSSQWRVSSSGFREMLRASGHRRVFQEAEGGVGVRGRAVGVRMGPGTTDGDGLPFARVGVGCVLRVLSVLSRMSRRRGGSVEQFGGCVGVRPRTAAALRVLATTLMRWYGLVSAPLLVSASLVTC